MRTTIAGKMYSRNFEELDYRVTPLGAVSLRRRRLPPDGEDVFEIKLGDEFLMTSRFTASEIALADLGLADTAVSDAEVVVGGLGLGYTAQAVLEDDSVQSLLVVEVLDAVIDWHRDGLLPLGPGLTGDRRCRFVQGDFFALARSAEGFDPDAPGRRFDAVLVDIDHSPEFFLNPQNADFYEPEGLEALLNRLKPGGVFGLWSNDPPDDTFTRRLAAAFDTARAETVTFFNPQQDRDVVQTVYLARA